MTNSQCCNSTASFIATSTFEFLDTAETYSASVSFRSTGLVEALLHDFRVAFTPYQAHQVAACLIQAIGHLGVSLTNSYERKTLNLLDSIGQWTQLILPNLPAPEAGTAELRHQGFGPAFVASGVFRDPAPQVAFEDESQAIYDISVMPHKDAIMLKFGWVGWIFTPNEAEWLADQLWTAALLAAKQPVYSIST
ncbi:hypothetical protein IAE39_000638 [Pseudomonas sp. S37]|uniref:hypothetical protein n=1 Tax=Pseudomonas sp. S37 TaxID=2767449 RepID=UPI00191266C9|nr:hypothetical protein [Pseudomonas sp. S37]MBK4992464.1 hypothetical protein [Pseudomonas sp. S37]